MKRKKLLIKKLFARLLLTAGAALGVVSCLRHTVNRPESVYGPPPQDIPDIEVLEDVYGPPPVDTVCDTPAVIDRDKVSRPRVPKPQPNVYGPPPVRR